MANVKITALEHLSSTQVAPEDVFVIDHVGPLITKKITLANVTKYLTTVSGNAKLVENNLISFATYANANAAALSLAIANISANFSIAGDSGSDVVVVGSETLTFRGRNGVNTTVGANELVVSMSNTGVNTGTYGGSDGTIIKVPTITIDAQGRITLAQNTNVSVDFSSVNSNIDLVQSNLTSTVGELSNLLTSEKANVVAAINEVKSSITFDLARFRLQGVTINNVNSFGSVIFTENKTNNHFAKLLINVEDLTYGQYQSSEILLIQDETTTRIVEYGIVHTSTNPIATYEASIVGANVELFATAVSSNNRINVLKITN